MFTTNYISSTAKIGQNVTIKENVIIGDNVVIGDNSYIDYNVIIRDNVKIGEHAFIGARCILGEFNMGFIQDREAYVNPALIIGRNAVLRSETIIYAGSVIGDNLQTGHRVTVREKTQAGKNFRVGTLSDIQGDCIIGDYVNLHSNVHIGQKSEIANYVWIFPYVVLTNDPTPPSNNLLGVKVEEFAVIATMSVILPGVTIGAGALVGAGSIVGKNVTAEMVVIGNPSKEICHNSKIKNKATGEQVYPWQNNFSRGMPWENLGYNAWLKNSIEK